jgi:hypothetical protein
MFSDGVFAVLITVPVLELRPPELPTFRALLALWPTWLSYAVSYLFIAIVWANHHHLLRYATETTPGLMWFNFAHLFSVSLHVGPIGRDPVPIRCGCGCSAEISSCWTRNLLLLPDRLSEAGSTGSREATIALYQRPGAMNFRYCSSPSSWPGVSRPYMPSGAPAKSWVAGPSPAMTMGNVGGDDGNFGAYGT